MYLVNFAFFYRCNCLTVDLECTVSNKTCANLPDAWRASCLRVQAPFGLGSLSTVISGRGDAFGAGAFAPRVWGRVFDQKCQPSFREAHVGLWLKGKENKELYENWPNPEFTLAPYGLWLFPRSLPSCLPNTTWVEVIHVRETWEVNGAPWFYHAPGSGVWLNTGRSACLGRAYQLDAESFSGTDDVATWPSLSRRGFVYASGNLEQETSNLARTFDTVQRNGPTGNLLEIVDLRAESKCSHGRKQGCTCVPTVRGGWNARRRQCHCDESRRL